MASKTYTAVGNREDLIDIITNISPDDTPLYSKFGRTKATGMTHSWLTDSLGTPGANKHLEDADYAMSAATARVKLDNNIQIMQRGYFVTESQQAVLKAAIKDELAYQMQKCTKELGLDVEWAYMNNATRAVSASATEGQMGGIPYFNDANVVAAAGAAVTEDVINDAMQAAYNQGGKPDWAIVSGKNKRAISKFSGMALRTRSMDEKKLTTIVDVIETDFGLVNIKLHRLQANTRIDLLQTDMWKTAYLIPFATKEPPQDSLKIGKVITGQLTCECRSKIANAAITGLPA